MNAAIAHARAVLITLHPANPAAQLSWLALIGGACGLTIASSSIDGTQFGTRLIAGLFLLAATAGLSGLRQAQWTPRGGERHLPLPIGRHTRRWVEIALYLIMAVVVALPLVAGMALLRSQASVATSTDTAAAMVAGDLLSLAKAVVLVAPLLVAILPGESRHGPIALLRLLLPWLPLGVASTAGWLTEPAGVLLTLLTMWLITLTLLALRRTGWEDWWPHLPDFAIDKRKIRQGLAPPMRLRADYRAGLRNGISWGLGLSALAWATLLGASRGVIDQDWNVAALLLIAAAFLATAYASMNIPLAARIRPWKAGAVPWSLLPLPHGEMQKRIHSSQALTWLVLAAAQLLALWLVYLGLAGGRTVLFGTEFVVGMLLPMIPALMVIEAFGSNASRPTGFIPSVVAAVLGFGTAMIPLIAATALLGEHPGTTAPQALSAMAALQRLLAVAGPATLLGMAWLAAGRLMILRDQARQR
jgi:hypothetical protein